ncbi:rhomboid family domain-containing protein [Ditylenchus destructor]|uniref:rhomboid protease n=1 Tax=Ditylenchus destructor TaxID=166010 RepID=A0AAD4QZP7_9BILA|nr:rhomboid family domain-containing protein [Ditylenchus destructor]
MTEMTAVPMETLACQSFQECGEWFSLFKAFDVDNDGLIPANELKIAIRESAYSFGLNADEAEFLIYNVDANKDDYVDFPEFSSLMARAKRMRLRRVILYAARSVLPKPQQTESVRYLLHYNCLPPPIFLFLISIMQLAVYIYYAVSTGVGLSATKPVPTDSPFILNPHKKWEIWRYVTYMFIHIGYVHLATNLVVQFLLGIPLELVHKFWRIGLIYVLGVISGALLFFVFDKNSNIYLAGASGGVYTLLSAHIANVIINWSEMELNWVRASVLSIFVGADVGMAIYERFFQGANKVSYISHIGGFIAGLLLGIVILRNLRLMPWENYARWAALAIFVVYIFTCIVIIVLSPSSVTHSKLI